MKTPGRKLSLTLTTILLVFLLILVLLPHGIRWAIQDQLVKRGADSATISDVNFNPFKGVLVIEDLVVQRQGTEQLNASYIFVDIDWLSLFERHVLIHNIELNGAAVTVRLDEEGRWYLDGLGEPILDPSVAPVEPVETGEDRAPWTVQLESLSLTGTRLGYGMPQWQGALHIEDLEILSLNTRNTDQTTQIDISGEFNDAPLLIRAELSPFIPQPEFRIRTRLQALQLAQFQPFLPGDWQLESGRLSMDGDWQIRQTDATGWSIDYTGDLELTDPAMLNPAVEVRSQTLNWNGSLGLNLPGGDRRPGLALDGKLDHAGLDLRLPEQRLAIRHERLGYQGSLKLEDVGTPETLTATGTLETTAVNISQTEPGLELLNAGAIRLQAIRIEGLDNMRLESLAISAARALSQPEGTNAANAVFATDAVTLNDIEIRDTLHLSVERVDLGKAEVDLLRRADGSFAGIAALGGAGTAVGDEAAAGTEEGEEEQAEAEAGQTDTQAGTTASVEIAALQLTGGSTLSFTDQTVEPAFTKTLILDRLTLEQIATARPEQPLKLDIAAHTESYIELAASGWARPFGERVSTDIELDLDHLTLPPLSPYMAMATGYRIRSGSLSTDSRIRIEDDQLDISNNLRLDQFHVEPVGEAQRQRIDAKLSMPLGTALSTLRDDNDNITLELPVTGDLNQPSFDISDVINKALAKALKAAAVNYIKFALQPYGTLITVGQFVGEKISHIKLEPVGFDAGAVGLDADADEYLHKIQELLANRPDLQLKICGYAVAADRQAMLASRQAVIAAEQEKSTEPQKRSLMDRLTGAPEPEPPPAPEPEPVTDAELQDLAAARAMTIKDTLVQEHGLEPGRLFTCNPEIDTAEGASARVELSL